MNRLFRSAAEKYNNNPTFELLSIEGFVPQALDIEKADELVKV